MTCRDENKVRQRLLANSYRRTPIAPSIDHRSFLACRVSVVLVDLIPRSKQAALIESLTCNILLEVFLHFFWM